MKGYIFEYYKYFRCTAESLDFFRTEPPILDYKNAEKSILTFGEFDRLKVNPVESFTRYRDFSTLGKAWLGNRQSLLLYELDENNKFSCREIDQGYEFLLNGNPDDHLFWALTEFPFQNSEREKCTSYHELLIDTKKVINEMIPENNNMDVKYEVFGTFGTFGIVVLWMADQFTDILNLVNRIVNINKSESFVTARTFFSKNSKYINIPRTHNKLEKLKGEALIQFTLKKSLDVQPKFLLPDDVKVIKTIHTPGEYDIGLMMSAKDALYLFETNDFFNHDKDEYQQRFFQTKVTLCEELEFEKIGIDNPNKKCIANLDIKKLLTNLEQVKETYEDIRTLMGKKIAKTAGLIDTLDSLICDYRSNVVSAVNESWAEDFSYVFLKNLECIQELLKMSPGGEFSRSPENILDILRMIMNNLKQQIFHIAEANNLNLEAPKCHLRYTGQEDGLLFCYMGIIKEILCTAYQLKSCNKQSEIVPIVTVDVVPIIESDLYFDKKTYINEKEADQDFKILGLNLPHVSFYEIPVYYQFMYHEIYHYIVPEDRERRDYVLGIILTICYLTNLLEKCLKNIMSSEETAGKIVYSLLPLIRKSVCDNYLTLHKCITTIDGIGKCRNERDTVLFISDNYVEKLFESLKNLEGKEFIKGCLIQIGKQLSLTKSTTTGAEPLKRIIPDEKKYENAVQFFNCGEEDRCIEKTMQNWGEQFSYLNKYLDGLKEVAADIPMIDLTKMPLSEYLLFYANCMKTEMVLPESLDQKEEIKEYLRIGIILDQYSIKGESLNKVKNEFIFKFVAKYFYHDFSVGSVDDLQQKLSRLYREAEKWCDFFEKCEKRYKEKQIFIPLFREYCKLYAVASRIDKEISDEHFKGYRLAIEKFAETMENIYNGMAERSLEQSRKIYEEGKRCYNDAMFLENVRLFQHFQKQTSLEKLHKTLIERNKLKKEDISNPNLDGPFELSESTVVEKSEKNNIRVRYASSFEELIREIQDAISMLKKSVKIHLGISDLKIWYRGQENAEYGLLPSILRKTTGNKRSFNYLAQYQRYLFGEFKFRCDGAAEMHDSSHFGDSDYLALMQHFGVHTNLMDWTENAFTALYFALEKVLIGEKSDSKTDAALWIFSPQLYNEARKYMIMNEAAKEACTEAAFQKSLKTTEGYDGMIPNISVKQNESIFDMFLLGNVEYESPNKYGYKEEKQLSGHEEMVYLPIAAYTSRLNPRIKAQSGIFVAYNLYAEPSKITEYDYMELNRIQEYYFQHCNREHKEQFLYKISIKRNAVRDIAGCIRNMGINKEAVYPELENVGKRVK